MVADERCECGDLAGVHIDDGYGYCLNPDCDCDRFRAKT